MDYKKYNLYKAYIETGNPKHNNRPVLLLEDDNQYKIFDIYNITHDDSNDDKPEENKNSNYIYNYKIKKWKEAGLDKPSLIKIREVLNIEKKLLFLRIGELQIEDIKGLENLMTKMYEDDQKALEKYNKSIGNKIIISQDIIDSFKKNDSNEIKNPTENSQEDTYTDDLEL